VLSHVFFLSLFAPLFLPKRNILEVLFFSFKPSFIFLEEQETIFLTSPLVREIIAPLLFSPPFFYCEPNLRRLIQKRVGNQMSPQLNKQAFFKNYNGFFG